MITEMRFGEVKKKHFLIDKKVLKWYIIYKREKQKTTLTLWQGENYDNQAVFNQIRKNNDERAT